MSGSQFDFTNYSGLVFTGTDPIFTGSNISPRKCRFCDGVEPDVSFDKDTAHSISESLGNVNFISYDECKSCNHYFSVLEQSFYRAHAPMLMLCGISGKDNGKRKGDVKSLSGADCKISSSQNGFLIALNKDAFAKYDEEARVNHTFTLEPNLKFEKFKLIDVYKSLCKYVVSMLPEELMPKFELTRKWLLGKFSFESLPNVVTTCTGFTKHPIVGYFLRKKDSCYPFAVGFVRVAMVAYIFIIPGANNDTIFPANDWLIGFANNLYQDKMAIYSKNFNSYEKIAPKMPIEIDNIQLGKTCFYCDKNDLQL